MKPKTTIVLIILLIVIGLSVWLSKVIQRRTKEEAISSVGKVFPQATGEAKKLTIENRDGTKLVFVYTNDRWNMIEPRLLPARTEAVEPIIRMMADLTYRRALSAKDAGAPSETVMGLDRPRWTVILTDAAENTYTLQVGSATPNVGGGDETYVRTGDQGSVFVVPQNLGTLLQHEVKDYRDMTVLPEVPRDDIVAVRIQGRQNYTLGKTDGLWDITQPFTIRADTSAVRELLTKLTTDLKAERFLTEAAVSPTPYGLDRPQLVVTVTTRQTPSPTASQPTETHKTYALLLGNHRGKSICAMVKGKPEVFTLPEAMLEDLQPGMDTLRAKTLLSFQPIDVKRIQIDRGGETMVLQRNGAWSMTQPFNGPTEAGAVDELLQTLMHIKADTWIASPQTSQSMSLSSPRATISLHTRNGGRQTLRIGNPSGDGKGVFCQPNDVPAIALVNPGDVDKVLQPAKQYWSGTLLPIAPETGIQGMTIDRPDGSYVLAKYDDAWRLAAPVIGRADAKAVETILKTLAGLQATKIVTLGESLPKAYAEAKDRITVSLTTRDGADDEPSSTWRLCVAMIGDDVFAWREGQPVVAVGACPTSLYTTLAQPLQEAK